MNLPQLIPKSSVTLRGTERVPDMGPNVFNIEKKMWNVKPRLDIQLQRDAAPVLVKKMVLDSSTNVKDMFKLKYKSDKSEPVWSGYNDFESDKIKVCWAPEMLLGISLHGFIEDDEILFSFSWMKKNSIPHWKPLSSESCPRVQAAFQRTTLSEWKSSAAMRTSLLKSVSQKPFY